MYNLGTVRPGSTIRIPFSTFDKDDGSAITMTNFAAADILIYKDGGTTERASTSGFTATTDFDAKTGKHVIVIDLADNTTAGFFTAGSEYLVALDSVTVDTVTTGGWMARFVIGYQGAMLDTTIATLSSQTSFTLTAGPAEDDALNGQWAIIHDVASAVQHARVLILDYTGSTKTVTLAAGATFTVAAGDNISVMGMAPMQPTVLGRTLDVSTGGEGGLDWANIGSPTTIVSLSGTTIATTTNLTNLPTIPTNWLTADGLNTDAVQEIRGAITGGAYALDTDANGRVRIVDGTGTGELDTSSGTVTAGAISANAITSSALATSAVDEIVDQVWDELLSGHAGVGSTGAALSAAGGSGDPWSTALPGAYASGTAGFIVGTNLNATVSSRSSHSASDVWAVATRTLTALGFTLGASDLAADTITAAKVAADVSTEIRNAVTGGAYALDTDANGRVRVVDGTGAGEIATTLGVIDSVTTVGSVSGNVGGNVTGTIGGFTAGAKAEIQTEAEDALVVHRLDELLNADSDIDGAAPPTVGSVFHELMSKTAGSFTFDQTTDSLEAVRDRGDAAWITATGFSTLTQADIRTAVGLASANLDTQLSTIDTVVDSILADTGTDGVVVNAAGLATDAVQEIRNSITGGAYALDTDVNGRVRIVDGTAAGELDTSSGAVIAASLGTQAKADVNAEVLDVLYTDTHAEPSQGTPAATASFGTKLDWLYMAWRNKKTQTSSEQKLFADDGTTVVAKSSVSDDGTTLTIGEFATGP